LKQPEAVTFDFFKTLVRPGAGRTRGEAYGDYLQTLGLPHASWEHRMLYDIFAYYRKAYHPSLAPDQKRLFWLEFTRRLFALTGVPFNRDGEIRAHVSAIEGIFSSDFLTVYDDVPAVLGSLRRRGLKLALLSNWPGGLDYYCEELGIRACFQFCLASSDFGRDKPDPSIFHEAVRRLGCAPGAVIHVGDSLAEDAEGAAGAGLKAVLIDRTGSAAASAGEIPVIKNLHELDRMLRD